MTINPSNPHHNLSKGLITVTKRAKPLARFNAAIPLFIANDKTTRRVSRAVWDMLPAENRDMYRGCRYVTDAQGRQVLKSYNVYQKVDTVPPYPNPAVKALRAKLKRQRLNAAEWTEDRGGITFLCFSTTHHKG